MKIISVVGARPNFMKIAPFIRAIEDYNKIYSGEIQHILVHTGQHYDDRMSRSFFDSLGIPEADINLGIGSGSHAEQVGNTMIAFEKILKQEKPDWVVVVGDINATLACSVTAKKENIRVCHIEAGLRSGDMTMPEEINRLVTDRLSDLLLVPDKISEKNLLAEGCRPEQIVLTGNIMIDTLDNNLEEASKIDLVSLVKNNLARGEKPKLTLRDGNFAVVTLHRPSNVDDKNTLQEIVAFLGDDIAGRIPVVWPVHPRTEKRLKDFSLWTALQKNTNIQLLSPLGYHEMLRLNKGARIMLTDSGGLQEECTVLGTNCITMRWNTERPVTLLAHGGASVLVGNDIQLLEKEFNRLLVQKVSPVRPEKWDGKTAMRCVKAIVSHSKV